MVQEERLSFLFRHYWRSKATVHRVDPPGQELIVIGRYLVFFRASKNVCHVDVIEVNRMPCCGKLMDLVGNINMHGNAPRMHKKPNLA